MTDARFPERWLNDGRLQRVSAAAYRTFGNALMWTVANKTDGHLPADVLVLIPHASEADIKELASVSLLVDHPSDGWLFADFEGTQTSRADHERREAERAAESASRKRRRHHAGGDHSLCSDDNCGMSGRTSGGTSADMSGDKSGRSPLGKGQGQGTYEQEPSTGLGAGERDSTTSSASNTGTTCLGCDRKPRHGVRTCWDHAHLESGPA